MKAKKQKRLERHDALAAARASGEMVRLRCGPEDNWQYEAYVVGLSKYFIAIHNALEHALLNGYTVFPLREVLAVELPATFLHRALQLSGELPKEPEGIILDDWASLLASADAHFPLVTLHPGNRYPGTCHIGRVAGVGKRGVLLREITPNAEWDEKPTLYRFKDITQVDFGGRYEAALWRVAQTDGGGVRKYRLSEG